MMSPPHDRCYRFKFSGTYVFGEVSCDDRRHDAGDGPECVCDAQKESSVTAGQQTETERLSEHPIISLKTTSTQRSIGASHPPGGDVDLVDEDSGGAHPSCGRGQSEEGDGEDVAAAGVTDGNEEGCRQHAPCTEREKKKKKP